MMITIRDTDGAPVRVLRMRSRDLIDYATRYQRRRGAPEC